MWPSLSQAKDLKEIFLALKQAPEFVDRRGKGQEIIDFSLTFKDVEGTTFFSTESRTKDINYVAAQLSWYARGRQLMDGIEKYRPKMWARVTDGLSSKSGDPRHADINSNYGEYVFLEGQLQRVIQRLNKDPMSRQAVILFNRPGVLASDTKDHICTTSMQFLVRKGLLHAITTMRSNELWNGFRYDVAFFTFLMDYVRAELSALGRGGIQLGNYTHNVGSFHVYDEDASGLDEEPTATVIPPLQPGEGPALIRELPEVERLFLNVSRPSSGLSILGENGRDWEHYASMIRLLLNAQHEPTFNARS